MAVYRATIFGTIAGQQTQNVLHFTKPDGASSEQLACAVAVRDHWVDQVRNVLFNEMTFNLIRVKEVAHNMWAATDLPILLSGTRAASALYIPFVAVVLKFKGDDSTRHSRGRTYLAGSGGTGYDRGNWTTSTMVGHQALCDALTLFWVAPNHTNGFSLVIAPRDNPDEFRPVVQIIPRLKIGSQVRRNLGRGA